MAQTKEQHQSLWKSRKKCGGEPGNDQTAFEGESMSHTRRVQYYQDRTRLDKWRAKPRAYSSVSLTSRELFTNNSSQQAMQSIPHRTVTIYGNCMKICEDFAPNFGDKRTGCCITTTQSHTFFITREFIYPKQHYSSPPTPLFCVSTIEDKIESSPFWHNWDDQGRMAVGAEHYHRTKLPWPIKKNYISAGKWGYARKGTTSKAEGASRP
jgi:hypothetical protein